MLQLSVWRMCVILMLGNPQSPLYRNVCYIDGWCIVLTLGQQKDHVFHIHLVYLLGHYLLTSPHTYTHACMNVHAFIYSAQFNLWWMILIHCFNISGQKTLSTSLSRIGWTCALEPWSTGQLASGSHSVTPYITSWELHTSYSMGCQVSNTPYYPSNSSNSN